MAAPSTYHLFTDLFHKIDIILTTFVSDTAGRLIITITPIIAVCLFIWLIWHAYNVMMGHSQMPVADLIKRCLLWSIVVSLALTAGTYQSGIGEIVRTLPNDLANSIISNGSPQSNALGSMLDQTADTGIDKAKEFWNHPTGTFGYGKAIVLSVVGFDVLLSTLILCVGGFFMLALATIAISFLAALGPLFIAALMFDSTRSFFFAWLSHVLYWVMFLCLFALIITFTMNMYGFYLNNIKIDDDLASWAGTVFAANVIALFGVIFFFQIPKVAAGLTGGAGHTTLGSAGGIMRTVVSTVFAMKSLGLTKVAGAGAKASAGAIGQTAQGAASASASTSAPPRNYNRGRNAA